MTSNNCRPTVSITVLLYNSAEYLRSCLLSIREDVLSGFAELLIVDNASPDDSVAIVTRELPEGKLIRSDVNRGFSGGCNLAWPHVQGRYWLLLNPDVVVPEGGLRKLVTWMDEHPEIGIASPDVTDRGGQTCPGRPFPSIALTLLEASRVHLLFPASLRGRLLRGHYWSGGDQLDVDWVPGTVMLVRPEAVEDAGLLSELFFMYGEDIEWCWRIGRAGWRIGVYSQTEFQHYAATSSRRTWGVSETRQRIERGLYDACCLMRGPIYSRLLLAARALSFAVESLHPLRSGHHRTNARNLLRANVVLLGQRLEGGPVHPVTKSKREGLG